MLATARWSGVHWDMATGGTSRSEVETYWSATTRGDVDAAYDVFCGVVDRGVPLAEVLERLVSATQHRVGDLWACHEWTVDQEHHATAVGEAVLDRLSARRPAHPRGPRVLLSCVEREWHTMACLLLAVRLRAAGVRVEHRGGDVDAAELAERIEASRPRAVLLSASVSSSLTSAAELVRTCRTLRTPVMVGGAAFDRAGIRAARLGATAYAATAEQALPRLMALPVRTEPPPVVLRPDVREARRLDASSDELAGRVLETLRGRLDLEDVAERAREDWRAVLVTLVPHVVESLTAALLTSDPTVLTEMRAWLDDVLRARRADPRCGVELWRALEIELAGRPRAQAMLTGRA